MRSCSVYVGLHPASIALKLTLIFHPPVVPQTLAAYLSLCPSTQDVVLDFSRVDTLTFPLPHDPPPSSLYQTLPHPAQRSSDVKRSLGQIASCNGHVSRDQVRYFNPQRDCLRTSDNSVASLSFSKIFQDQGLVRQLELASFLADGQPGRTTRRFSRIRRQALQLRLVRPLLDQIFRALL